MKALTLHGKQDLRFEEVEAPAIASHDDVIIRVFYAGVCGSDLSRFKKIGPLTPGNVFGHECAGVVEAVGSKVTNVQVGDRVGVCPALKCGTCVECRSGRFFACAHLLVIGAKEPGAYAEYVKVPEENVLKLPENIPLKDAAFIEPSAVVLHGLYRTSLSPGKTVAIYGCGTIGLLACQWAKNFGASNVYAIDIDPEKLALARQLGADVAIKPVEGSSSYAQLMEVTSNLGVDLAIEAAGSPITSAEVFAAPKKGGEVLFLGIPYSDIKMERFYFERIVRQELTVLGSWNAVSAPFPGKEFYTTIQFLQEKKLQLEPMVSHCLPLEEGPSMFDAVTSGEAKVNKILFELAVE